MGVRNKLGTECSPKPKVSDVGNSSLAQEMEITCLSVHNYCKYSRFKLKQEVGL